MLCCWVSGSGTHKHSASEVEGRAEVAAPTQAPLPPPLLQDRTDGSGGVACLEVGLPPPDAQRQTV